MSRNPESRAERPALPEGWWLAFALAAVLVAAGAGVVGLIAVLL